MAERVLYLGPHARLIGEPIVHVGHGPVEQRRQFQTRVRLDPGTHLVAGTGHSQQVVLQEFVHGLGHRSFLGRLVFGTACPDRLPAGADQSRQQREGDDGSRRDRHLVAASELAEAIAGRRRPGHDRLVTQVPCQVRSQPVRRLVAAAAFLFQALHHDPVQISGNDLRQSLWLELPLRCNRW